MSGHSETIKLTANFKLDGPSSLVEPLFSTYQDVLNELLSYAHAKRITSFKRLKAEKYREFRAKWPELPSHYIYTIRPVKWPVPSIKLSGS